MNSALVWIGGLLGGAAAGVAVAYLVTGGGQQPAAAPTTAGGGAPTTPTPTTPAPASGGTTTTPAAPVWNLWNGTSAIPNSVGLRVSMTPAQMTAALGGATPTAANVTTLFTAAWHSGWALQGTDVTVYAPGSALPSDWPTSGDPSAASNWHVDLVLSTGPVPFANIPKAAAIWIHQEPVAILGTKQ